MAGRTFFWLAVFEVNEIVYVTQQDPKARPSDAVATRQAVTRSMNRRGRVNISPGETTEDVVDRIIAGCKEDDVPHDAVLTNIVLLPNRMASQ